MRIALQRIIRYGYKAFVRDKGSSSAVLLIMLVTLSLVVSLFLVRGVAHYAVEALKSRANVSVYFKNAVQEQEILNLNTELLNLSEVREVNYISQEDALEKFKIMHQDDPVIVASLEVLGKNPLLASLAIRAWKAEEYARVVEFLEQSSLQKGIEKIDYQDREPIIRRITALAVGVQSAGFLLTFFLSLIVVLVTYNTVRLAIFNASKEVEIMRLVGAPNLFIRGPFLVQGVMGGLIAALITVLIFLPLTFLLAQPLEKLVSGFNLFQYFISNFFVIFLLQLVVGIGLGTLSSLIAIRRYLQI